MLVLWTAVEGLWYRRQEVIHYFDRSRMETDNKCPRRLYWEYYYDGKGLQPVKINQHLAFGSAVHEAIADILEYCRDLDMLPNSEQVSMCVRAAQTTLRAEFDKAKGFQAATILEEGFDGEMIQVTDDQTWMVDHYCDLLEGLVVGWCLVRLPLLMQQYRVVQVETEEQLQLGEYATYGHEESGITGRHIDDYDVDTWGLTFLSRPDAIFERRTDGALVILSLKTVSQVNQMWLENFKTDQQTISEVLPVEARLGREVAGVQIEGLVKGAQAVDWPKGAGHKHHASPLIWGYSKEESGLSWDWEVKYEWRDEAGNTRRLGKGWNRQRISESYPGGIVEWVKYLNSGDNELLRAQFPSPPLISRSANELEEWQTQVKYRETEIGNALVTINTLSDLGVGVEGLLAQVFPKHTTGCAYDAQFHSKCPCYSLCWGSQGADPIGCGEFQYRVTNHPEETTK
jgi:hypothetical protein